MRARERAQEPAAPPNRSPHFLNGWRTRNSRTFPEGDEVPAARAERVLAGCVRAWRCREARGPPLPQTRMDSQVGDAVGPPDEPACVARGASSCARLGWGAARAPRKEGGQGSPNVDPGASAALESGSQTSQGARPERGGGDAERPAGLRENRFVSGGPAGWRQGPLSLLYSRADSLVSGIFICGGGAYIFLVVPRLS